MQKALAIMVLTDDALPQENGRVAPGAARWRGSRRRAVVRCAAKRRWAVAFFPEPKWSHHRTLRLRRCPA